MIKPKAVNVWQYTICEHVTGLEENDEGVSTKDEYIHVSHKFLQVIRN